MSNLDEAEKFYRHLLRQLPCDHRNVADCHYSLGIVIDEKIDYESNLK